MIKLYSNEKHPFNIYHSFNIKSQIILFIQNLNNYDSIKWLLSFQQIQKPTISLKETKKEKDNFSYKNNSKNQDNNQYYYYYSNDDGAIDFNFSDISIFDTDKIIQRKPKCTCGGKCSNCKAADDITNIPNIQMKFKISQLDDPLEREADRIAEKIVDTNYMNSNIQSDNKNKGNKTLNRKCSKCKEEDEDKEKPIQISRKTDIKNKQNLEISNETNNKIKNVINHGGNPLDTQIKKFMESKFGFDFSNVRIHTDDIAAKTANSINALAYTIENNIIFARGLYQPNTIEGKSLLVHELTHVLQQNSRSMQIQIQRSPDRPMMVAPEPFEPFPEGYVTWEELEQQQLSKTLSFANGEPLNLKTLVAWAVNLYGKGMSLENVYKNLIFSHDFIGTEEMRYDALIDLKFELEKESTKELLKETRRKMKILETPYNERLNKAEWQVVKSHWEKIHGDWRKKGWKHSRDNTIFNADEIWNYGINNELLLPGEKKFVYEDLKVRAKKTFKERYHDARYWAQVEYKDYWRSDPSTWVPSENVWTYGIKFNLFLEYEKDAVIAERNKELGIKKEEYEERNEAIRRKAEIEAYNAHVARGKQLSDPRPILQGFAFGAFGAPVAIVAGGIQVGATVYHVKQACTNGTESECRDAKVSVGIGIASYLFMRHIMSKEPKNMSLTHSRAQGGGQAAGRSGDIEDYFDISVPKVNPTTGHEHIVFKLKTAPNFSLEAVRDLKSGNVMIKDLSKDPSANLIAGIMNGEVYRAVPPPSPSSTMVKGSPIGTAEDIIVTAPTGLSASSTGRTLSAGTSTNIATTGMLVPPQIKGIGPAYRTLDELDAAIKSGTISLERKDNKMAHILGVIVRNPKGKTISIWFEVSELGVGIEGAKLLGHTEQKALRRISVMGLESGSTITFVGHLSPCNLTGGCSMNMSDYTSETGNYIDYRHIYGVDGTTIHEFTPEGRITQKERKKWKIN
jgi:hypothetical protein